MYRIVSPDTALFVYSAWFAKVHFVKFDVLMTFTMIDYSWAGHVLHAWTKPDTAFV